MMLGGSNTILYSNRNQPTEVTRVCTYISASRNRKVSEHAGINDQGQISKLMLSRLEGQGLVENTCASQMHRGISPVQGIDDRPRTVGSAWDGKLDRMVVRAQTPCKLRQTLCAGTTPPKKGNKMTKASSIVTSLRYRLGTYRRVRLDAFAGTGASKIITTSAGTRASSGTPAVNRVQPLPTAGKLTTRLKPQLFGVAVIPITLLTLLFTAPALAAPGTPTLEHVSHTATEATLKVTVTPTAFAEGDTYELLYKKSPTECTTGSHSTPGLIVAEQFEETLKGLEPGAQYTVCVQIENAAHETAESTPPVTFTTLPETPFTREATSITSNSATLNGELNPKTSAEVAYEFKYNITSSGEGCEGSGATTTESGKKTGTPIKVSEHVTELGGKELEGNTEYTFCVLALNNAGEPATASPLTFKTLALPPQITGSPTATAVTPFEEKLEATVNPENQPTSSCVFEYDEGVEAKTVPCAPSSVEGASPQTVTASLAGLQAGTIYHFRVVAKNATGANPPAEGEFMTLPKEAPKVENVRASEVTPFEAKLEAEVNPEYQRTTCAIEYGMVVTERKAKCVPPTLEGSGSQSVSLQVKGLEAGATYHVRVVAENAEHEKTVEVAEFTTLPKEAPKVENVHASGVTPYEATLDAEVNPEYQKTTCEIQYGLTTASYGPLAPCSPAILVGSGNQGVSRAVKGLEPNTSYHIRVVAKNTADEETAEIGEFKTLPKEVPVVESESASVQSPFEATLETMVDPDYQKTSCEFEYSTIKADIGTASAKTAACNPASLGEGGPGASASLALTGLTSKTSYYYRVVVTNGTGTAEGTLAEPIAKFETQTATAPAIEGESSSGVTPFEAKLEATVNPDYQRTKVTFEYATEESLVLEGKGTQDSAPEIPAVAGGQRVSVKLAALTAGRKYYFRVIATNETGTAENTGEIKNFETLPANAPTVVSESALDVSASGAELEAKIDPNYQATTYEFEYATKASGEALEGTIVKVPGGSIPAGSGEFPAGPVNLGLSSGTQYFYRVVATNAAGTSKGNVESFTTGAAVALPPPGTPKPWWHLRTEPEPTYFHGGLAKNEVQEIEATPGETEILGHKLEGAAFQISVNGRSLGTFATEPGAKEWNEFGILVDHAGPVTAATKQSIQAALEASGAYASGAVNLQEKAGVLPGSVVFTVTSRDPASISVAPAPLVSFGEAHATVVTKGRPDGELLVSATNLGDGDASGEPSTVSDILPPGLEAVGVWGESSLVVEGQASGLPQQLQCSLKVENGVAGPACSLTGSVPPYTGLTLHVEVDDVGASGQISDRASVSGGGARPLSHPFPIPLGESTPFGIADYELVNENEGGSPDTQAGSHPFQQTTTIVLNQSVNPAETNPGYPTGLIEPAADVKDLAPLWPAGLIGNPASLPQCPTAVFLAGACPDDTAIGVARPLYSLNQGGGPNPGIERGPLYNLVPDPGEPAHFAFKTGAGPVYIDPSVRSGKDYGVTVNSDNTTQLVGFRGIEVTVWGTPGSEQFSRLRGRACLAESVAEGPVCATSPEEHPTAFLSLPVSCPVNQATGQPEPLLSTITGDSWLEPKSTAEQPELTEGFKMSALDGCNKLPFRPEIVATPDVHAASTPGGLNVDVHVPQAETLNPGGLAEAEPRDITVALPVGVALNPSSADGLQACSADPGDLATGQLGSAGDQIGFQGHGESPLEPGVNNALFTGELPESIAAKVAAEAGETPQSETTLSPGTNFCPNGSKIGTATVKTPDLPEKEPLTGSVYLASQEANPFGSVLAMYIVVENEQAGVMAKIAGDVTLCERAGQQVGGTDGLPCRAPRQIIATFENSPQVAFEDAEVHFFGGERAPLSTPAHCGTYTTTAAFTPWSATPGEAPVIAESSFGIETGPKSSAYPSGGPCPGNPLPFSPSLRGAALNINAGAFSPFTATFSRLSGEQNMQSIKAVLPPGLSGILTGIELCPEPAANEGKCGPNSLIGETTVSVGVGGEPYTDSGGKFYLTGPYNGSGACTVGTPNCAPFGITFEVPATAGPFDLAKTAANHPACDCVLVRGKIEINPFTSQITITSNAPGTPDSIPTELEGIPLEIQHVNAITTRNNFQFNPTNCSKMNVEGTIDSSEGATDTLAVPFQVTNCKQLNFTPKFKVSVGAKTSKADGESLSTTVSEPAGALGTQSNLTKVKVELPKDLPSRLTTLQKACTNAQFESNPAACPPESKIGYAVVHTPLIPVPLEGPAIFVSHGGEAFPSLTMVLQGYGITIDLVGTTFISKSGVTSTTFKTVPDQPFTSFTLTLPTGKFSALTALGNVCKEKLSMPTEFVAQNGMEIHQTTPISVTGCAKTKTRAQKLAAALKACHKKKGSKRASCEKAARKKFGPLKKAKKSSHNGRAK
jgi:phosphodiesterase/alkaline phosphatase D-like protein